MQKTMRTWIEINQKALHANAERFLKLIPAHTRFMAVIKSNGYGHGLIQTASTLSKIQALSFKLQFAVDSMTEALRLRREGIKNSILVLGYTLPSRMKEAEEQKISLTISSFESLSAHAQLKKPPEFHIKIDTGLHRQGFLPRDIPKLIKLLQSYKLKPQAVYTHFAAANDISGRAYTKKQIQEFENALSTFRSAGIRDIIVHAAATGSVLQFPETHYDMARIGAGLYGIWPSDDLRKKYASEIPLRSLLTWKTIISEIKEIPKGSYVGYDCAERLARDTTIAILPVGYWHGYDRGLSGKGEVLARGRRGRVLGRVSMDMTVVDVTDIPRISVGNEVVLLGKQKKEVITPEELTEKINSTPYEFLTRINPLIKRITIM